MKTNVRFLTGAEFEAFGEVFCVLISETLENIIVAADKHNVDRDNAVQYFASIFKNMAEISTFRNYPTKKEKR